MFFESLFVSVVSDPNPARTRARPEKPGPIYNSGTQVLKRFLDQYTKTFDFLKNKKPRSTAALDLYKYVTIHMFDDLSQIESFHKSDFGPFAKKLKVNWSHVTKACDSGQAVSSM